MIFYFSASGNGKRAAELISSRTGESIVSIAQALREGRRSFDVSSEDTVGFVIPTYFYNTPKAVLRFIEELDITGAEGKYGYVVVTLSSRSGNTGREVAKLLADKGVDVRAQYAVRTVYAYMPAMELPEPDEIGAILDDADSQCLRIAEQVNGREEGEFNGFVGTVAAAVSKGMLAAYDKAAATSNFSVSGSCDGCGLCTDVCPESMITLENGVPVWNADACTMCLGCLQRCPRAAIQHGDATAGRSRFLNPRTGMPEGPL